MELKGEIALYLTVFVAACGLWFLFSSTPLNLPTKLKAVITAACIFPALLLFYTKFAAPKTIPPAVGKSNNPQWIPSTQALDMCQTTWGKHAISQSSDTHCCMIFEYVMKLHNRSEWGTVLDAGTGSHSLSWVIGLNSAGWTAITGSQQRADNMMNTFKGKIRPDVDKVIFGNWLDPKLLKGEEYDVVLADYLLGSLDGFAPYFQDKLFDRLRPHIKKDLFFVGMEPVPDSANTPQGELIIEIAKTRDACILLAGHRCYREYPLDWVVRHLTKSGFKIENVANFETIQTADFVEIQLNVAESKLPFIKDLQLAESMATHIKQLRKKIFSMKWNIRFGSDYVVHASKIPKAEP